jgi:hypothetical protein
MVPGNKIGPSTVSHDFHFSRAKIKDDQSLKKLWKIFSQDIDNHSCKICELLNVKKDMQ